MNYGALYDVRIGEMAGVVFYLCHANVMNKYSNPYYRSENYYKKIKTTL